MDEFNAHAFAETCIKNTQDVSTSDGWTRKHPADLIDNWTRS